MRATYEPDDTTFPAEAYRVAGYRGIAWHVYGWETEPDEDGEPVRTGQVVAVMVGDDRWFAFDPDDVSPLDESAYCPECGQIGCNALAGARGDA